MKVGQIPTEYLDGQRNLDRAQGGDLDLSTLLDLMQVHRVPGNVETAQHDPAVDATWEDWDVVTALNLVLSTPIRLNEAVLLRGTLEYVNGEAATNNAKFADGGTPDDDDTVRTFATAAAAASEFEQHTLITDGSGNIKVESDDVANLGFVFHLESFQYVRFAAST